MVMRACVVLFTMVLILTACAPSAGVTAGYPSATASPDDGVLLVFMRRFSFSSQFDDIKDEERILGCVSRAIHSRRPRQRIVLFDDFRRVAFPHLTPATAPRSPDYLAILFEDSDFRKRVAPLGLSHAAFVGGVTRLSDARGGMSCSGDAVRAVCIGAWYWDKESRVGASILDLRDMERDEEISASARGTPWFAIVQGIPLGFPAATESEACIGLGRDIARYLDGEWPRPSGGGRAARE